MPRDILPSVHKRLRADFHPKLHQTFPDHNNKVQFITMVWKKWEMLNNSHHAKPLELNKLQWEHGNCKGKWCEWAYTVIKSQSSQNSPNPFSESRQMLHGAHHTQGHRTAWMNSLLKTQHNGRQDLKLLARVTQGCLRWCWTQDSCMLALPERLVPLAGFQMSDAARCSVSSPAAHCCDSTASNPSVCLHAPCVTTCLCLARQTAL